MTSLLSQETNEVKKALEQFVADHGVCIWQYHADNCRFADNTFKQHCSQQHQTISYCGVNAHFQNGIAERATLTLQEPCWFMQKQDGQVQCIFVCGQMQPWWLCTYITQHQCCLMENHGLSYVLVSMCELAWKTIMCLHVQHLLCKTAFQQAIPHPYGLQDHILALT